MNIRSKLILMLAIPLAALVIVAFVGFRSQNISEQANSDAAVSTETIVALNSLWVNIAEERIAVLGDASNAEALELIEQTELAIDAIEEAGDTVAWAVATEAEQALPSIRNASLVAPNNEASALTILGQYVEALTIIEDGIAEVPLDGLGADAVLTASGLENARTGLRESETAWLHLLVLESDVDQTEARAIAAEWAVANALIDSVDHLETADGNQPFRAAATSNAASELARVEAVTTNELVTFEGTELAIDTLTGSLTSVSGVDVSDALAESRAEWSAASEAAENFIRSDVAATAADLEEARSLTTLLALLGGLLLITLLFVIGRSIVGPLGRLMENADVMTHERLPAAVAQLRSVGSSDEEVKLAPIPKEADDEIGTIVEAFNDMQASALKVATDQARSRRNVAEMFVSLGRRNQQLNHRMITMISDLERDEQDPETLRGLYQLDHLATRMRRNAESLLVLAGNRSPRQWSQPVPFDDVVRSSLAEVEYFERIEIGELPDVQMSGSVVTDITHLLAELLDNATQFSDPTTSVVISAIETHTAVEMQISDQGFGINHQDLLVLNERVTNPPALDEAPSRLLGLFVVGRLAVEHDVYVQLASESGEGTTVTISIPKTHFPVEVGENPVDLSGDSTDINSDNASDFFGNSNSDVAPPVLTDISGSDDALPVRVTQDQDSDELPVRQVAQEEVAQQDDSESEESDESDDLPVRGVVAPVEDPTEALDEVDSASEESADESVESLELPIESAAADAEADTWPLTKMDPVPEHEASAMDVAQRDVEQDDDAEQAELAAVEEIPVSESVVEPTPISPDMADSGASSFGGLPTRMPQATIETVDTAPAVLPLEIAGSETAESDDKATSSISFGHFAKGVEQGLDDVNSDEGNNS